MVVDWIRDDLVEVCVKVQEDLNIALRSFNNAELTYFMKIASLVNNVEE